MQLDPATLDDILKGTSRAFYLSLAVLPAGARAPLSLAYLLARAADTVADSPCDPSLDRLGLLRALRAIVAERSTTAWSEAAPRLDLVRPQSDRERQLLAATESLLLLLEQRPESEQRAIREVVGTLIEGMIWDQQLFEPPASSAASEPRSLRGLEEQELERYTYLVAGCVGPFWSRVCSFTDPRLSHLGDERHDSTAIEFGKGLQWVNILRDIPRDQQSGRFYLPDLRRTNFSSRFEKSSRRALSALERALTYPGLFPAHFLRHRMAVFWMLVLACRTLEGLFRHGGPRELGERVKVPRWEVLAWVALSPLLVCHDRLLEAVLKRLWRRAEEALSKLEDTYAKNSEIGSSGPDGYGADGCGERPDAGQAR